MAEVAYQNNGAILLASSVNTRDWELLKARYRVGDFVMSCCEAAAIPKTSSNGRHFFAHQFGDCATAPETKWHIEAKALLERSLTIMGFEAHNEKVGNGWKADVFFRFGERSFVVEAQHSYQTLADYRKRQKRYWDDKIEAYWLLYPKCYLTLSTAMGKWRLKHEFAGRLPPSGIFPCVRDIPVATLETEPELRVTGAGRFFCTLQEWLRSLIDRRFEWECGKWQILP